MGSPEGGEGLVLLGFLQAGRDDVAPNETLEFQFSAALDPASVSAASLQIRADGGLGPAAQGTYDVDGAIVRFRPDYAGRCDLSDAGLLPLRSYDVTLAGASSGAPLRTTGGTALGETLSRSFRTAAEADPALYPQAPEPLALLSTSPLAGAQAVAVETGNRIELVLSETLRPCTVHGSSVRLRMVQRGDPTAFVPAEGGAGNPSGFVTEDGRTDDQAPADPDSWGDATQLPHTTTLTPAQVLPTRITLVQDATSTRILLTPDMTSPGLENATRGRFPENALLVVELTDAIESVDGDRLAPQTLSFTTENRPREEWTRTVDARGATPFESAATTADVDTARAPEQIQGFLLFAGDGDNGSELLDPARPATGLDCDTERQSDDGTPDDFDPTDDVLLDTGSTHNQCANRVDGSRAVVWEFRSLRIRNGVTVRVVGRNPAILLVQGDVQIDEGGRLLLRGDGEGGAPQGAGEGDKPPSTSAGTAGGIGVAGGGDGGGSPVGIGTLDPPRLGGHGTQGYHHDGTGQPAADIGAPGGSGGGHGNISARWNEQDNPNNRNTPSGGGAGHAVAGEAGTALGSGDLPTSLDGDVDGAAGGTYGSADGRLRFPEAGSGGGAAGELRPFSSNVGRGPGGAGGSGGGFLDVSAGGDMTILGTIDAAGSPGGSNESGALTPTYAWNPGTGGGGGGSGGGLRLLTPRDITLGASTVLTVAGGAGGKGRLSHGAVSPPANDGGNGGHGRIVLEDGNAVIAGLASASVVPGEGTAGFHRGLFDGSRFQQGGLRSEARTEPFLVGVFDPAFEAPAASDWRVRIPAGTGRGTDQVSILVEARGFEMAPTGGAELGAPTDWHTVGWFSDSGVADAPTWHLGQPDVAALGGALPADNAGTAGIGHLDGAEYIQVRITFLLPDGLDADDGGPAVEQWNIRTSSDH